MIIGLCGLKQSGKDTIAAYLVKANGFERKAFADPLKRSVAALFDIPFADVDRYKLDEDMEVQIRTKGAYPTLHSIMTFRELLQRYGTEAHRDIFGNQFWVDQTLPVQGFYPGRSIVVTDVRFREEAERVITLGGRVIRVIRENAAPSIKDLHRSEDLSDVEPFVTATIHNDGSLDELYDKVEDILATSPIETLC